MLTSGSRHAVAQRATGGEDWVLECAVSVAERWMGHRAVRGVVGGLLVGREGAVGVGRGRDADQRLQRHGVAQRATGKIGFSNVPCPLQNAGWATGPCGESWEGFSWGGKGLGVGRGRDADQRLQRHGVAQRATGGEEWVLECAVSVADTQIHIHIFWRIHRYTECAVSC